MALIDLSMTIKGHWRWPVQQEFVHELNKGDPFQVSVLKIPMHAFTHIDTPLHIQPHGKTIDEVPLNQLTGQAAIFDLSFVNANEAISGTDLEKAGRHLAPGDIVLIKTEWDLKRDSATREFWTEAPYLEEEAAVWLARQEIKAVGFDFPQDYYIREIPLRQVLPQELPTHHLILRTGIYLIEYLCNLHKIHVDRVKLFALPLKIGGSEGAPARIIAVDD
jgi:kynurenine formamidase